MNEMAEAILKVMEVYNKPVTISEIADELVISKAFAFKTIRELIAQGKVKEYLTNGRIKYYALAVEAKTDEIQLNRFINELNQKYANLDADLQTKSDALDKRIEEVENNTKNIYLNIISIISVFIAIFTLIITNIQVLKDYISVDDTLCTVAAKMAVINISLVIVIFFVLLMIRYLVLKPLKSKQCKKESKE